MQQKEPPTGSPSPLKPAHLNLRLIIISNFECKQYILSVPKLYYQFMVMSTLCDWEYIEIQDGYI